ncbi:amino acid ABC transporter permease [Viridibacillus arvi]|jgi:putative glutamine transport system permease protein|uniref:Glutamine ABC transporter permease n=1 Tax=Viridibacillus arvi TaxID=263475 RepID=A0A0M0LG49_9BACL|nr:amino acid ABC transporter permease [Viridibacillus arvi]KOO50014.1 glutamine ABC transporter permease [Viridibacillus arvi]
MLDFTILTNNWDMYVEGFKNTLLTSLLALIGSFLFGTLLAVFRIAPIKSLNWIGTIYVEFFRNIPLLIIAFTLYAGFPTLGIELDGFQAGTIALIIYTSAFISEAVRAGILSVHKGQTEAARSSGLTYIETMRYVVLPQAIKIVIPPLGNQFINLVKNSSILSVIAAGELMYQADLISARTYVVFDVYIIVALFYLVITLPLSYGVNYLEKRLAKSN